ncbi:hypothetical protein [Paenibacillus kribbensis]|nr:hypothetical protein [Paenibacillus kribbensis]
MKRGAAADQFHQYEDSVTRTDYSTGETSRITSVSLVVVTELTGKDGTQT